MNQKTIQDDGQGREKGSNIFSGKILKGTLNQAPIKVKVSSIPSKNQNIIYRSFSQPAFGDSTSKFYDPSAASKKLNPGPGNYNHEPNDSKIYSKKGFGSFASTSKLSRIERVRSHIPGPGTYSLKSTLQLKKKIKTSLKDQKKSSKSFMNDMPSTNTAVLSAQIQNRDIFKNEIKRAKLIPGPGCYDFYVDGSFQNTLEQINFNRLKKSNSLMNYNFKSKIQRFSEKQKIVPPVGYYNVQNNNLQENKKSIKYEEKKYQRSQKEKVEEKIEKLFNKDKVGMIKNLGPGAYNPQPSKTSKAFTIKETIHDRFGNLKPIYAMAKTLNIDDERYEDLNNEYFSSHKNGTNTTNYNFTGQNFMIPRGPDSVFKSATKRTQLILQNKIGPCKYNIQKSPEKKSHLINFSRKWVGV